MYESFIGGGMSDCGQCTIRLHGARSSLGLGVRGPDLSRKLQELKIEVPIIYVTANSDDHVVAGRLPTARCLPGEPFDVKFAWRDPQALNGSK